MFDCTRNVNYNELRISADTFNDSELRPWLDIPFTIVPSESIPKDAVLVMDDICVTLVDPSNI
jgi:hypothetical protein